MSREVENMCPWWEWVYFINDLQKKQPPIYHKSKCKKGTWHANHFIFARFLQTLNFVFLMKKNLTKCLLIKTARLSKKIIVANKVEEKVLVHCYPVNATCTMNVPKTTSSSIPRSIWNRNKTGNKILEEEDAPVKIGVLDCAKKYASNGTNYERAQDK